MKFPWTRTYPICIHCGFPIKDQIVPWGPDGPIHIVICLNARYDERKAELQAAIEEVKGEQDVQNRSSTQAGQAGI